MKTRSIIMLVCIALLTSCAGKFGVMKRRYNKGYYVSVNGDRATKKISKEKAAPVAKPSPEENVAVQVVPKTERPAVKAEQLFPSSATALSAKRDPKTVSANATHHAAALRMEIRELPKVAELKRNADYAKSADSASDTNTILLVILAIFIPPLAVFLKDKAVSKWFWITLILSIIGIFGYTFLFFLGGIAWLLAVIFAILYVLDKLN